jgi:hypothetical protein
MLYNMFKLYSAELRIRDVYPGSEFFHPGSRAKKIPDPRSASKNVPKNQDVLGNMIRHVHPVSESWIRI